MAIVLDAMGSDHYPQPELQAAVDAARLFGEEILLVGKEELLADDLKRLNAGGYPVRIVDAPDVLEMGEKPVDAARRKPKNSMAVGLELVKNGEASAFVTAGNTGGAMFNAYRTLRFLDGVLRPALSALFPVRGGRAVITDIGANSDCRPEFLLQFAVLGSVYARKILKIENPRIGLLSNGEEAGKGNQLVRDTYPLLEQSGLNFVGNLEGKEVYGGMADVVITDGFTGNVFLKSSEAVAKFLLELMKEQLTASLPAKLAGAMARPYLRNLRQVMDPAEVGAAPLLGVNGLVFVGHGRSDARALVSAIRAAREAVQADLLEAMRSAIREQMAQIDALITQNAPRRKE